MNRHFAKSNIYRIVVLSSALTLLPDLSKAETKTISDDTKRATRQAEENSRAAAEYHFSLAQAYGSDGDLDHSIEEYKLALMFDQKSPLIYGRLASEYVKKGMLSAAMEAAKEAVKLNPKYGDARLILAGLYSASHDTTLALTEYDAILKNDPSNEEAIVYKSQILIDDGQPEKSQKVLANYIKKHPESPLALYYLGRVEQQLDHFNQAVSAYRKAMAVKPGFSQPGLALGYLYEEKQMNAKAIEAYNALYESTQDVAAANRLATVLLKEEKYKEALPYLQIVQAGDPDDLNARVKLGLVEMELKKYPEAIVTFKAILEKHPESDRLHFYLGSLYEENKQTDLAISELQLIKPDSKLYPDSVLHVVYLLKQNQNLAKAKSFLEDAIKKAPKITTFYIFQASLEDEGGNTHQAVEILSTAVKEFPEEEKLRYYLGSLYDRLGELDKGIEQMEAILKLNPENVDALNYIGYTWTQKGIHLSDAEKLLRKALGLRPDNGYIQDSWGWFLFIQGKVDQAIAQLEKANQTKPNEPTILEHLGDAYLRSNLREKALVKYTDAIRYSEDREAKKKIEAKAENLKKEIMESKNQDLSSQERVPASKVKE